MPAAPASTMSRPRNIHDDAFENQSFQMSAESRLLGAGSDAGSRTHLMVGASDQNIRSLANQTVIVPSTSAPKGSLAKIAQNSKFVTNHEHMYMQSQTNFFERRNKSNEDPNMERRVHHQTTEQFFQKRQQSQHEAKRQKLNNNSQRNNEIYIHSTQNKKKKSTPLDKQLVQLMKTDKLKPLDCKMKKSGRATASLFQSLNTPYNDNQVL